MKKKILFVIPSLDAGGGEKSLINLLNALDYSRVEVEVRLFSKRGLFLDLVPPGVSVTEIGGNYRFFSQGIAASAIHLLSRFALGVFVNRLLFAARNWWHSNKAVAEQRTWANKKAVIDRDPEQYDLVVAFVEKSSVYYVVDKVLAHRKIAWIHTNYTSSGLDPAFDRHYFEQCDFLVTVSDECRQSLIDNFPMLSGRIHVLENIVSPGTVRALAAASVADASFSDDGDIIVTVARLSPEKGIDIALEACRILVQDRPRLRWYIIGDGPQRTELGELIANSGLEDNFVLLGLRANPYPYIESATLYVQPSRYEGKSIAVEEAKILAKPIVVTGFDTAKDQITPEVDGVISGRSAHELAADIARVLDDAALREKLSLHLKDVHSDKSQQIVQQFYSFLDA